MRPTKTAMPSHLNLLYRQLAAMTASGMTISDSIKALAEEAEGSPLRNIVRQMHKELEQGTSVGEVAMQHLHLLRGLPASVLDRELPAVSQFFSEMAEFNEKRQTLRRFLILSFVYPAFVATLAFAVLAMLLIVSVPMFASMYEDTAGVLPLPTRIVIAFSNLFSTTWFVVPIFIIAALIVLLNNKMLLYTLADSIPFVRSLHRKIAGAEILRALSLLSRLEIPAAEALLSAATSLTNRYFSRRLTDLALQARSFSQAITFMRQYELAPAMINHMVRTGENSSTLAVALYESARYMEQDAEKTYGLFAVLLYPALIVLLGTIIGFIILALYMPIFQLGSIAT